jgi:hypothetical protein
VKLDPIFVGLQSVFDTCVVFFIAQTDVFLFGKLLFGGFELLLLL